MRADFINPFIVATLQVINQEMGRPIKIEKGELSYLDSSYTSLDVTVLIGVTGAVQGVVMFGLSERFAKNIVGGMLGKPVPIMDPMVESAIAEFGNVVTGIASGGLEKAGFPCTLAPPTLMVGRGMMISTINIKRLHIPFTSEFGDMAVSVALRESRIR